MKKQVLLWVAVLALGACMYPGMDKDPVLGGDARALVQAQSNDPGAAARAGTKPVKGIDGKRAEIMIENQRRDAATSSNPVSSPVMLKIGQ